MGTCIACLHATRTVGLFCTRCAKAYDKAKHKSDGTVAAMYRWLANRVRREERRRQRELELQRSLDELHHQPVTAWDHDAKP